MSSKETFIGWVTKYALSTGVVERTLQETNTPGMVKDATAAYATYYHSKDWYRTREEAIKRAEEMRSAKLRSMEKSLAKLKALKF